MSSLRCALFSGAAALAILLASVPSLAQSEQASGSQSQNSRSEPSALPNGAAIQTPADQPGSITGVVQDVSGASVVGAHVVLTREGQTPLEALSDTDGQYSFIGVAPGPFTLTFTANGFAAQSSAGTLSPGEAHFAAAVTLVVARNVTKVEVSMTQEQIAEEQIKEQEKQHVLGIVPNYYVTYAADAVPLNTRQKFKLAWKFNIDPFNFLIVGAIAGIEQGQDHFHEFGQGFEGYAKRYGVNYADQVTSTFIGGAILPSLFKQDPRYFYKGTGSVRSRTLYAIGMSVICKGDNGKWQPAYSAILGSLAAGGISNLYYPSDDRGGAGLTFENAGVGIVATAAANLFQEFLVRKLTPGLKHRNAGQGASQANGP
jgi:hypothetical protein